jgi:hypothetical protein
MKYFIISSIIILSVLLSGCISILSPSSQSSSVLDSTKCVLPSIFDSSSNTITRSYPYIINGQEGSITLTLNDKWKDYFSCRSDEIGPARVENYILISKQKILMKETEKYSALNPLVDAIKSKSTDPDVQARIAVNLVQHIPANCKLEQEVQALNYSENIHFPSPYEVLYQNTGICDDKSVLLASLLHQLGYNSAYIAFDFQHHAMAGIGTNGNDQYKNKFGNSGFSLIETTNTYPIGLIPPIIDYNSQITTMNQNSGKNFTLTNQDYEDIAYFKTHNGIRNNDLIQRYGYGTPPCS